MQQLSLFPSIVPHGMIVDTRLNKIKLLAALGLDQSIISCREIDYLANRMTQESDTMTYIHRVFYKIYQADGPLYVAVMLGELDDLNLLDWFQS